MYSDRSCAVVGHFKRSRIFCGNVGILWKSFSVIFRHWYFKIYFLTSNFWNLSYHLKIYFKIHFWGLKVWKIKEAYFQVSPEKTMPKIPTISQTSHFTKHFTVARLKIGYWNAWEKRVENMQLPVQQTTYTSTIRHHPGSTPALSPSTRP